MKKTIIVAVSIYASLLASAPAAFGAQQNSSPKPEVPPAIQTGQAAPVLGQPATQPGGAVQNSAPVPAAPSDQPATPRQGQPSAAQASNPSAQALFEESLRLMMPIDKGQIQEFREWSDDRDRALLPVSPALNSRTVRVSLEPGRTPVKVFTTANIATSIVFHDSTGKPWPVTSVTNGGPNFFQVLRPELPEGNLLNIMPLQAYGASTIVVTMAKRDVPLVIRLEADSVRSPQRTADALVLFQLAHQGPNAEMPITQGVKDTASSAMLAFLDQVPPKDAVRIKTEPSLQDVKIWKLNETYYVRTIHTLIWPAWTSVVNGAGDVKCYESQITPRLLFSQKGNITSVRIKEQGK